MLWATVKGRVGLGKAALQISAEGAHILAPRRKDGRLGGLQAHGDAVSSAPRQQPPGGTRNTLGSALKPGCKPRSPSLAEHPAEAEFLHSGASCARELGCVLGCAGGRYPGTQGVSLLVGTLHKRTFPRVCVCMRISTHLPYKDGKLL